MSVYNRNRVVFYGRNDYAASHFKKRVVELLEEPAASNVTTINDAIEAYQCKVTVDELPELFDEDNLPLLQRNARQLFSHACRFANQALEQTSLVELYEEAETQYRSTFWSFLVASGAYKKLKYGSIDVLSRVHPECLFHIMKSKRLVNANGQEIREAMLENPRQAAEHIILELATITSSKERLTLPVELTDDDLNAIMQGYLNEDHPNLNYVKALALWPKDTDDRYRPSPETIVLARKREQAMTKEMFAEHGGIRYGTGVCISEVQHACKGVVADGLDITHIFGSAWLESWLDFPTIMNNLIYVFDYVDPWGNMAMPAHAHDETALMALFGLRVRDEYRVTLPFQMRNKLALTETMAYSSFLEQHGIRLESVLEWVYNSYFEEEIGIKGFSLSLPVKEATWLDKCKSIGPEIERAIKAYVVYAEHGEADDDYFPFVRVKSFSDPPSLCGDSYAVAGEEFEAYAPALFSDQSLLAYPGSSDAGDRCFYDLMLNHTVTRGDYEESLQQMIDWLMEESLVVESEQDGSMEPTLLSAALRIVWEGGSIPLMRCSQGDRNVLDSLVTKGLLDYRHTLFSPDEAAYLDYIYNNASFSNSLGLRNRHDHANAAIANPNSESMRIDYYQLMTILIAITLKINGELQRKTGKGGPIEFVDWPLYDESVFQIVANGRG